MQVSSKFTESMEDDTVLYAAGPSPRQGRPPLPQLPLAPPDTHPASARMTNGNSSYEDSKLALPTRPPSSLQVARPPSVTSQLSGRFGTDMSTHRDALLGPRRPKPHKIWRKKFIKLMVVGDSGLGKTTLIRTLLSTPGERLQVHDGTYTSAEQFRKDPESLCSTITWKDEDDRVIWVYRIQDTPGYGDDLNIMNSIGMMLEHIERQNLKWLEMEQAKDRKEDLSEVEDPRIDICIYCLPPHRLRPIDLRYMHELGKSVPVLPVITKADTMTIREATLYRQEVYNKLQDPKLPGIRSKINVFQFEKETLERAGVLDAASSATPPFLVVASNDINEELNLAADNPVFWPERRYPWGTAEAFNPEHSDLLHLRALLLKEALEEIGRTKRYRYEAWRSRALSGFKVGRIVRRVLFFTLVPLALGVQAGRAGITARDVAGAPAKVNGALRTFLGLQADDEPTAQRQPTPAPVPAPELQVRNQQPAAAAASSQPHPLPTPTTASHRTPLFPPTPAPGRRREGA